MTTPKRCQEEVAQDSRRGSSLVEVVVAMVVLTYGLIGMAGSTMYFVREVTVADLSTKRTVAVRSAFERARALPFDSLVAGVDSIGEYELAWSVAAEGARTNRITVITTGPGLVSGMAGPVISASECDTVDFRTYRP